jgi:tRNA modification GTPase
METIFAQTSAKGKSGVAVFRISGEKTRYLLQQLTQKPNSLPGVLQLRKIYDFRTSPPYCIDQAMIVFFQNPKSFTGEDVAEIHTHGSIAVADMLLETLASCENVRIAEPGEFTKRAFWNNKIDLTQIEGLSDLIEAETSMQHRQASKQMLGELGKLYESWKTQLTEILALIEVFIDFPEEELPLEILDKSKSAMLNLKSQILSHINDNRRGERLRSGISLGIFGEPNVGKSSLINCLTRRDVSIVTNIAGTTRDILEAHLDIGGYPIIISDTAGIRHNYSDEIEKIGINKAKDLFANCDIKIILLDASNDAPISESIASLKDEDTIIAINKIDISNTKNITDAILLSCKTQYGVKDLTDAIIKKAEKLAMPSSLPGLTRSRYRNILEKALQCIDTALLIQDPVFISEEIRLACHHMRCLTGEIGVEDVLGSIFANFCIGK